MNNFSYLFWKIVEGVPYLAHVAMVAFTEGILISAWCANYPDAAGFYFCEIFQGYVGCHALFSHSKIVSAEL